MRSRLLLALIPAALTLGLVAGSCSSSKGTAASTTSADASPVETTVPAAVGAHPWWIVDGTVTPGEARPETATAADPVRAALDALLAGPNPTEASFGATTAIAPTVVVNSLVVSPDGIATVDLNRKFETADTRPQTAQVVYTLTQLPQVAKVRFLIDGQPNGATGVPPVGRTDLRFPVG